MRNRNLTTEDFIAKAKSVHGDKYDYSKSNYTKMSEKIIIICPIHGEFKQEAKGHIKGYNCPTCAKISNANNGKLTIDGFVTKAKKVHGNKYDYSLAIYLHGKIKIKIICPTHGIFEQMPALHLGGSNCPKCSKSYRQTQEEFITKANLIHNNKYNYSLLNYTKGLNKIKVICPTHGVFEQIARYHIKGNGCPKCAKINIANKQKLTVNEFIVKANLKHNGKYDYSLVKYQDTEIKVKIICPTHGIFSQVPHSHLKGSGCSKCAGFNKTTKEFIKIAELIHDKKYDYSLTNYINNKTKIKIICPIHGEFKQAPGSHLQGQGCSLCKTSKGENLIKKLLIEHEITFTQQFRFPNCKHKKLLAFDFYLSDNNTCIEYDGVQHYKPIKYFGGEKIFKELKVRDEIKKKYCEDNNIKLIRIKYCDDIEKELNKLMNYL